MDALLLLYLVQISLHPIIALVELFLWNVIKTFPIRDWDFCQSFLSMWTGLPPVAASWVANSRATLAAYNIHSMGWTNFSEDLICILIGNLGDLRIGWWKVSPLFRRLSLDWFLRLFDQGVQNIDQSTGVSTRGAQGFIVRRVGNFSTEITGRFCGHFTEFREAPSWMWIEGTVKVFN